MGLIERRQPGARITAQMKRDALMSCPFFQPLQAADLDAIVAHAIERRVGRGATIFEKGDAGSSMMAVLAGRVRVTSISNEGREVTLREMRPGDIFGEIALLDGKPRTASAIAVEDTTLVVVERQTFLPLLMRHEGMVERLLVVLCDRLRRTTMTLEEVALYDLPARLARVLCKLAADYGRPQPDGSVRIDLKLSQNDLGNLVASSRESVNKQIKLWRTRGIVATDGQYLTICKKQSLQAEFE